MTNPSPRMAIAIAAALVLAACTSAQDALEPSALIGPAGAAATPAAFPAAVPAGDGAALVTDARIRFAPPVGAPATATAPLADRLNARAAARGIVLADAADTAITHQMKGYFSTVTENGRTTVIYVWDVSDPAGTRVHRIQGQVAGAASGAEGWDAVAPQTMETIADETVDKLASWLAGRPSRG